MQFIEYPKCSTCQKAKKFLESNEVNFEDRNIITETPSIDELKLWQKKFDVPMKKLFNTSGLKYKKLNLKEKLLTMSEDEMFALLASDGMLIKRPLVIDNDFILIGFKEEEWNKLLKK